MSSMTYRLCHSLAVQSHAQLLPSLSDFLIHSMLMKQSELLLHCYMQATPRMCSKLIAICPIKILSGHFLCWWLNSFHASYHSDGLEKVFIPTFYVNRIKCDHPWFDWSLSSTPHLKVGLHKSQVMCDFQLQGCWCFTQPLMSPFGIPEGGRL